MRNYLLNVSHRDGGPKARCFLARGFSDADWQEFARVSGLHPVENPVLESELTGYGWKVVVRCTLRTPHGRNPCVRTVWMVEDAEAPRLITAYPSPG